MFNNFSVGLLFIGVVFVAVFVGYDLYKNSKTIPLRKYTFEQNARRWVLLALLALLALMSIVSQSHLWVQVFLALGSRIGFLWFWLHCCSKFMEYLATPKDARDNFPLVYDAKTMAVYAVLLVLLDKLVYLACLTYAWSLESVAVLGGALSLGGIYYIWSKRGSLQPQNEDYAATAAMVLIIMLSAATFSLINDQPPLSLAIEQERTIAPAQESSPPPSEEPAANPTTTLEEQAPVEEGSGGL